MITGYFIKITETAGAALAEARLNELPEELKNKITLYSSAHERLSRLCGKLMLGKLLTDNGFADISLSSIRYNEYAKPFFDAGPGFSIAHSGGIVICICCPGYKTGTDIEKIKEADIHSFKEHFTQKEWTMISESKNQAEAFYKTWVRKEAVIKATGKGIFLPMDEVDAGNDVVMADQDVYFIKDIFIEAGYAASIATNEKDPEIRITEISMKRLLAMPVKQ